jgi:phenylacetate-CoA ligase
VLLPTQRQAIENSFGVKVFDWYGHFERTIFIGTCKEGNYHIFPDYGITELLPAGVNDGGEAVFELVGTGFINSVMPLIRYRTGDLVTLCPETPCACGSSFPCIKDIKGRTNDFVVTDTGRKIGMLEFAFDNEFVRTGQIIQESLQKLTVLVVPEKGHSAEAEFLVMKDLRERVGSSMEIDLQFVESIPRELSGKNRMVVSRL